MKKRLMGLAMAVVLSAVTLAGCGGSSAPTNETTASGGGNVETISNGDETVLKWSVWDIHLTTYYEPLIKAFEAQNPGVRIEMVDLGSSDYQTVLATELTGSGSDFDIVTIKDIPGYATLVGKNVLESLDSYIEKDDLDLSVYGGIENQIDIDGQIYQLPFRNDFWLMFYNKEVFDAAGVDYPTNDMTFAEYDALVRSVSNPEPGSEVFGAHYHTWRSTTQLFGILDGQNSIVGGDYEFTKPYYEMVLAQQEDGICQDYATLKTSSLHYSGAFAQGNIAMMNMGSWFIPTLIEKIADGEYTEISNWGLAKYPHAAGVEAGSTVATITCLGIPTSAPNKDLAWEFVKFVCGEEGAEILASGGTIPAISSEKVAELVSAIEGFPQDGSSKEALMTTNLYLEMPVHEFNSEIETILNEAHDNIMVGNSTIDEGIQQMNDRVGALLGK